MEEDFKEISERGKARWQTENNAAYGDESAGRDVPRIARHLPGEASPEKTKKRERETERRILSALERLLLDDPIYRARYEAFGVFLTKSETRADNLLERAQFQIAAINNKIDDAVDRAPKLDGKAIFRFADGRVIDADGNEIPPDSVEGIIWPDDAMSAENYLALLAHREELEMVLRDLHEIRVDLGDARNEYENQESPITKDRMDGYEQKHRKRLDDLQQRIEGEEPEAVANSANTPTSPSKSAKPIL